MLIEKPGREPGQMAGKSPYLNAVHLQAAPGLVGSIVPVRVVSAQANSLAGSAPRRLASRSAERGAARPKTLAP